MLIRPAVDSDLEPLTDIYNHYVLETNATFDVEPFCYASRQQAWFRHYAPTGRHRLLVAEVDGVVAGYATSSPFRARAAYDTSVETSIYLAPEATRRGLGTALYTRLFAELGTEDVHRAYAAIALPNDPSVALHSRFGFYVAGLFTEVGRKFGQFWDVAWYQKNLGR